ncbi:hypothetical protein OCK74_18850 [Chitinophagaceae bacterium LB-8]|uniref:Uncharacterized protein n=1 Tax=Paraflavisolibacter caeni TaxID=2982496 RepID=A0A9X2XYJ7_9BACT|nr:hypothetical protein [Paraflavisolibacter caeni]MCU7551187.1 hypothetical protein [Paraflavisolibacter caeni]
MKNKEKYYKLDDVGIIGSQVKTSAAAQLYHKKKTGEVFRQARAAANSRRKISLKKVQ